MPENRANKPCWTKTDFAKPALTIMLRSIHIVVISPPHRCISHN